MHFKLCIWISFLSIYICRRHLPSTIKKKTYHWADIEANSGEVARQHAEEVKSVAEAVDIPTQNLLSVTTCYLGLKERDLVKPHITSLPNLYVLVVCHVSSSQCWVKTWMCNNTIFNHLRSYNLIFLSCKTKN